MRWANVHAWTALVSLANMVSIQSKGRGFPDWCGWRCGWPGMAGFCMMLLGSPHAAQWVRSRVDDWTIEARLSVGATRAG